ncbi:hypothetical protein SELSPUOL_00543 [Selenomonas sputigena ATCC 35185]|uniref:Uncharacterized protein n=1 Tax=Selenomonas sputigena (strain ATCC 35185 / DSM 20758 / CCUG 44933 / VPI D19B-28) TaxID=546271 RepID=C9LSW6_SELS3|nr:hypothetical protein SELSPUOL_00543 [Selenomonas sputigena ATCC 35185]
MSRNLKEIFQPSASRECIRQERTPQKSGSALLLSWDDGEEFAVVPFFSC